MAGLEYAEDFKRAEAVGMTAEIEPDLAEAGIAELLESEHESVRLAAVSSLAQLPDGERQRTARLTELALSNDMTSVRSLAAFLLPGITKGDPEMFWPLYEIAMDNPKRSVRRDAQQALQHLPGEELAKVLVAADQHLADEGPSVRRAAADTIMVGREMM